MAKVGNDITTKMEPTAQSTHWLLDEKYAQHLDETNSRDDIHTNSSKHKRISSQAILVYVIILLVSTSVYTDSGSILM